MEAALVLDLPTTFPRPATRAGDVAVRRGALSPELVAALRSQSVALEASLLAEVVCGFAVVLGRYSAQDAVVVGLPAAGPHGVTFLTARIDVSDGSVREALRRVDHEVALAAVTAAPADDLLSGGARQRDASRPPVVDAAVSVVGIPAVADTEFRSSPTLPPRPAGDVDIHLTVDIDNCSASVAYNAELFDPPAVDRLLGHVATVLEGLAADANRPVGELDILTAAERHQLLVEFNDTGTGEPPRPCIHELIEGQVVRSPEAVAVVAGDDQVTYAELDARANRLAHHLQSLGVGPEVVVGVCMERGIDWVVATLAVLKAGGAFLPLDVLLYPAERIAYVLSDSGTDVVVTSASLRESLPEVARVIEVDTEAAAIAARPGHAPDSGVGADNLAYVIYTSGSTGEPKGVMVCHRGAVNIELAIDHHIGRRADRRVLQFAPASFDVSVGDMILALTTGASLYLASLDSLLSGEALAAQLLDQGITNIQVSPTVLANVPVGDYPALQTVVVGAEVCPAELVARWAAPGRRFFNAYGPTEATIFTTFAECVPDGRPPPIGRPIANTEVYILDAARRPQPVGVPGELYIGGVGLARGYLNRPDLTAEAFVDHPFWPGARLYRTGDLARYRPDGVIEFLGRIDDQVKIRGFRIELGEVEVALRAQPGVREAVVAAREDGPGDRRLVGYVVPDGPAPSVSQLREGLGQRLPHYMVPAAFVVLEALPRSPNGKVDRAALPAPEGTRPALESSYLGPRTPTEEVLAAIWAEVLGLDQVGVEDNFFELGGDSILAIQVVSRAREAGLRITPKQFLEHQSVAALAGVAIAAPSVVAEQGPVTGPVPLTPAQRRFFAATPVDPHRYGCWIQVSLDPGTRLDVLEQAVGEVVTHHDALRHRFFEADGEWLQECVPVDAAPSCLVHVDLSGLDPDELPSRLAGERARLQADMDLGTPPLLRAAIVDLGSDGAQLVLVIHHLVVDNLSWRLLLEDLETAYQAIAAGEPALLPAKTTSYQVFAERLSAWADSAEIAEDLDYWSGPAPACPVPRDRVGENLVSSVEELTVGLETDETASLLQGVAVGCRAAQDELLLTALARAMGAWAGGPILRIDVEGHGREDVGEDIDTSRTVGWFSSVFPLDVPVLSERGPQLLAVKERLRAVPHGGTSHGLLRYVGGDEAATALKRLPPAEIRFSFLGQFEPFGDGSLIGSFTAVGGPEQSGRAHREYVIEVDAHVTGGRLSVRWTFSTALHDRATIASLAATFVGELRGLIHESRSALSASVLTPSDFPLASLTSDELARLVAGASPSGAAGIEDIYPLTGTQQGMLLHSLIDPANYHHQFACRVRDLDMTAFREAWHALVARHPVLRTSFWWDGVKTPHQVVHRTVALTVDEHDLRGVGESERVTRRGEYLAADQARGFDLAQAPMMRVALFATDDDAYDLVWSFHHVLLDAWCIPDLFAEVDARYASLTQGLPLELTPARPFRDYVAWLRNQEFDKAEEYWRRVLSGFEEPTSLGVDGGRPEQGAPSDYAERWVVLPDDVAAAAEAFSRATSVTLSTIVLGAWALLLSRYSGKEDVLFGWVVAGRPPELAGAEDIIGCLINALPLRVAVDPEAPAATWLRDLQRGQFEQRDHEFVPLLDIQRWSPLSSATPLFETVVEVERETLEESLNAGPATLQFDEPQLIEHNNYPLSVVALLRPSLRFRISYDRAHFGDAAIERLVGHLSTLLNGLVENGSRPIGELNMLTESERVLLLEEWTDTANATPDERGWLHELVAEQARDHPGTSAVVSESGTLALGELDARANRLAHHLREVGVDTGSFVGICLEPGPDLVIATLAVLKAGGAFVPLDPVMYPPERLALIADDSGLDVAVTDQAHAASLPDRVERVLVDGHSNEIEQRPSTAVECGTVAGDSVAYVTYTSGSTGQPKGVLTLHAGIRNRVLWMVDAYRMHEERVLMFAPYGFDDSVWEMFCSLLTGGAVVIPRSGGTRDPRYLVDVIRSQRVTMVQFVPSMLAAFLDQHDVSLCTSLRRVLCGSETLTADLVARFFACLDTELYNVYGPTETSIDCSHWRCAPGEKDPLAIGRPMWNMEMYVLDGQGRPVPIGVPGEIHIGGVGLAAGYLNRPDLTAQRFIPHPFRPGARLYRTGDIGRFREDGVIEFLGRDDDQVRIRGARVELGEVEATLEEHAAVRECAVVAREDRPGERRLVAYVVPVAGDDDRCQPGELRAFLASRLPTYMVPGTFVVLDRLPLNPNGKVDRRALPAPVRGRSPEAGMQQPRTAIEKLVAETWASVLQFEEVGLDDNFFELGGDSLLALRVVSELEAAVGAELPLRALFDAPTVSGVAAALETVTSDGAAEKAMAVLNEIEGLSDEEIARLLAEEATR